MDIVINLDPRVPSASSNNSFNLPSPERRLPVKATGLSLTSLIDITSRSESLLNLPKSCHVLFSYDDIDNNSMYG